jgi:hypothetical protein
VNGRERYAAVYSGERPDRLPIQGVGPWGETLERWRAEGLGSEADLNETLGLANDDALRLPLSMNMEPPFPVTVLELGERYVTLIDEFGVTKRLLRGDYDRSQGYKFNAGMTSSMAHWLDFPVKDLRSWKAIYEQRFQPTVSARLPEDWPERQGEFIRGSRTRWVTHFAFPFGGLFSACRELIGWPSLAYILADDPALIHTMVHDLVGFYLESWAIMLGEVRLDQITFFEDMCSTQAPLISPATFRDFFAPGYRVLIGVLRWMGVQHFFIDSDGNATLMIPEFLACGVTGVHPCEVNAGMDVGALREAFPTLDLNGGIDKRALAQGPAAIDAELERCFRVAWAKGRYTPSLDHGAPPDIPWDNVRYYAERYQEHCLSPERGENYHGPALLGNTKHTKKEI